MTKIICLMSLFSLALGGCAVLGVYNPATERREFIAIDTSAEVTMGKNIHQQITQSSRLSKDTAKTERLNRIGKSLEAVSDRKDYAYTFHLVEENELNAYTTPGGNIYFFSGLLDRLKTDDEVAAVVAHEIGHCAAKHTVKRFQAALGYNILSALIMSQAKIDDRTRTIVNAAGNIGAQLAVAAYSRKDEYEADRLGLKYMYLAGYDVDGMVKTFEMLAKESKGPKIPLILRTHPYIEDRIKAVRLQIPQIAERYGQPKIEP